MLIIGYTIAAGTALVLLALISIDLNRIARRHDDAARALRGIRNHLDRAELRGRFRGVQADYGRDKRRSAATITDSELDALYARIGA